MSNKRPLSPKSNDESTVDNSTRSLKRLKLHSLVQELVNEEANLLILKKLRSSQQLAIRAINTSTAINGFHRTATRVSTNKPTIPNFSIANSSSKPAVQQPLVSATRKALNATVPSLPSKIHTPIPTKPSLTTSPNLYVLEERKTQAKKALRAQLERDLLNIPSPKPLLRDILLIPNPASLEFQPYIGLEDVVQCLYELQTDRQHLPQRFTDRAQIDEPYICDHCGTDFTIRWWKHLSNSQQTNILCDRCKKQVIRRTSKSEHSALLKSVFVSAMDQEKEIEKTFQTLIKQQQKDASRSSSTSQPLIISNNRSLPSSQMQFKTSTRSYDHYRHHQLQKQQKTKPKQSMSQSQNFATKISQQSTPLISATRKSNVVVSSQMDQTNHIRSLPLNKMSMSTNQQMQQQQQQQQHFRSANSLSQHMKKTNQIVTPTKIPAVRQQQVVSSRPMYHQSRSDFNLVSNIYPIMPSLVDIRPTATKKRTLSIINMK